MSPLPNIMQGSNPDFAPDDQGYQGVAPDFFKQHTDPNQVPTPSAATVTSITPNTGPAAGGTAVVIKGTNLLGVTAVTIGGVAVTGLTVVDRQTVNATTGAHATGAVNVVVTDNSGTVTKTNFFTYT